MDKKHFYRLGVELLDRHKRPLEHAEYETTDDIDQALDLYDKWTIDETMGKYLILVTENGQEVEIKSDGYEVEKTPLDTERLETLLFKAICLLEDEYDYCIDNVVEELGMTSDEYDYIVYGE